ncbi:MAG: fasciclin domain-containing protein [Candidatus Nanopelagicales bacterium]|jgi:uncharacterized surface protein with fasciclin (FAS1) repeats|nr:fasciclin domain-containing protein [Candidatus Nanopelagicales bacterium]
MRKLATGVAAASALALTMGAAAPAMAAEQGTNPLAAVLTADGNTFDRNSKDFDIVTEAVLAVLKAKPSSPVGVLTDGTVAATAFVPNDQAFRILVEDLTGKHLRSERKIFKAVAGLGINTVEQVLLYHVVPGATIDSETALGANGAKLTTAQGGTFKVIVRDGGIRLRDKDYNSRNPRVIGVDVNEGNKQIAHVIDRVLRPMDLPPKKKR